MEHDFIIHYHGSISVLAPLSEEAETWCAENLPSDAPRWAGGYAIEARYSLDIENGLMAEGLTLEGLD